MIMNGELNQEAMGIYALGKAGFDGSHEAGIEAVRLWAVASDPIRRQLAKTLERMPCLSDEHLRIKDEALAAYRESMK